MWYLWEEFTPYQRFSEKEIWNLREPQPTFIKPCERFQESPKCFDISKCFINLKSKESLQNVITIWCFFVSSRPINVGKKGPNKIWCDSPFNVMLKLRIVFCWYHMTIWIVKKLRTDLDTYNMYTINKNLPLKLYTHCNMNAI